MLFGKLVNEGYKRGMALGILVNGVNGVRAGKMNNWLRVLEFRARHTSVGSFVASRAYVV